MFVIGLVCTAGELLLVACVAWSRAWHPGPKRDKRARIGWSPRCLLVSCGNHGLSCAGVPQDPLQEDLWGGIGIA